MSSSGHNLKWYSSKPGDDDPSKYLDEEEKTEDEKTYDLITSKYFKVGYIAGDESLLIRAAQFPHLGCGN